MVSNTVKIELRNELTMKLFDMLHGSSFSYSKKNYTLVEDTVLDILQDKKADRPLSEVFQLFMIVFLGSAF